MSEVYKRAASQREHCGKCKEKSMMRVERRGFWEEKIFPLFGLYPWECMGCRQQKLRRNRGLRESSKNHAGSEKQTVS